MGRIERVAFMCTHLLWFISSVVSDSFVTPWTVVCQASLSMGFPRQEYWSGLPFPSPEDLPDPWIEPVSPTLEGRFFIIESPGKPIYITTCKTENWWEAAIYLSQGSELDAL